MFFGCCCSPCSSGGCCWYPCHGSHLIRECATHCCVGIFALSVRQKVLGDLIDKTMFLLGCEMKKAGQCCPKQYGSGSKRNTLPTVCQFCQAALELGHHCAVTAAVARESGGPEAALWPDLGVHICLV